MKTYYIETFGCQMNELDSEKVSGLLSNRGLIASQDIQEADIVLFNTCSVREKAAQKVLSRLGTLRKLKKKNPDLVVAVLGCVAQQEGMDLIHKAPVVDIVAGPQKIYRIPSLINRVKEEGGPIVEIDFEKGPSPIEIDAILRESAFRAKITIQEGCNKFCSFCIVPFTRGREKNRPSDLILAETRRLADDGFVEILLLGQNVNSYIDPSPKSLSFAQLLEAVGSVSGIRRIRFTSPHPADFNLDVIKVMNNVPAICNQIHLPLQSGSNEVLKRMRRGYTRDDYLKVVEMIRSSPRSIAISTDLIVGFPGESKVDYESTLDVITKVGFTQAFSFIYSPRPHTAALRLSDDVPMEEKKKRLAILQEVQKKIQLGLYNRYLGLELQVLVEGQAKLRGELVGRTSENICVNFEGLQEWTGQFATVGIEQIHANSMAGRVTVVPSG